MIYEHARITVNPGDGTRFEDAFRASGREALATSRGCQSVQLLRSAEGPDVYLLVVGWNSIDDHLQHFPTTPQAEQLGAAIGSFFAAEPVVEHFDADAVA
jgi:heme-degrading monooxygenase HmoA